MTPGRGARFGRQSPPETRPPPFAQGIRGTTRTHGADFLSEVRIEETARSVAWNRLWSKMLSEVLAARRQPSPPDEWPE